MRPEIVVEKDYDGYFQRLVEKWVAFKETAGVEFNHNKIVIDSGPWRPAACTFVIKKSEPETIYLDFYSAIRAGFGNLSEVDEAEIINLL